jgi:hypoxanthine-DNA glycosylase
MEAGQYYAHPRNAFWPLMEQLFGNGIPLDYPSRIDLVLSARIAVWDVLSSAERVGSLDSAIVTESEVPNDIEGFLDDHPSITRVFFNGAKAEAAFKRHHADLLLRRGIDATRLPSTSPANAAASFERKVAAWSAVVHAARE